MSATTQVKRLRRVERRAIPEIVAAVHTGKLSVRLADQLLYLPKAQQKVELERRLALAQERETRNRLVAETVRSYLDTLNGQKVDLHQLGKIIQNALA